MSVNREITIRILSKKENFSDLFIAFTTDFWLDKNDLNISCLDKEDTEDYNFDFVDFQTLKSILDFRESKGYDNSLNFFVKKLDEEMLIRTTKLEGNYSDISEYEISFSPAIGKRLKHSKRNTDFSFYINQIVPQLLKIDCKIAEINCQDYDF